MSNYFDDDILKAFLQNEFFDFNVGFTPRKEVEIRRCPICKQSFADIERQGRVGCAECYHFFTEELKPTIRRLQGCVSMLGSPLDMRELEDVDDKKYVSRPQRNNADTRSDTRLTRKEADARQAEDVRQSEDARQASVLDKLQKELAAAIVSEDYRRAAHLKNEILRLNHPDEEKGGTDD